MENQIVLTIPGHWLGKRRVSPDELRQALQLGLELLRQHKPASDAATSVVQALLRTGRVQHLAVLTPENDSSSPRQTPPTIPGIPVSEILVAQRRGEL